MTRILEPGAASHESLGELLGELIVELPGFHGTLGELAAALRGGRVSSEVVPLLDLTRRVLARAQRLRELRPDAAANALPPLAGVIVLKARLLVPAPKEADPLPDEGEWFDESSDFTDSVQLLADLDALVSFLSERRKERAGVVAARRLDLDLPRRERPASPRGLEKLVRAARSAVREVAVPLLVRDRTTLKDALVNLRAYASRLRRFVFGSVTVQDWGERTTYFTALLEGVKDGEFDVWQDEMYGPIEVEARGCSPEGVSPPEP